MATEANKATTRRFYDEVLSQHNLAAFDELCTATFVEHGPGLTPDHGAEETKQMLGSLWTAFPDARVTVEDMIAEGDKVVARVRSQLTHQGEFMGLPPTGKAVTFTVMDLLQFEHGTIAEMWAEADMLGLLQQLGAIPKPGQAQQESAA